MQKIIGESALVKFKEIIERFCKINFDILFETKADKSELSELQNSLTQLTLGSDPRFTTLKEISDWIIQHESVIDRIKAIEDVNTQQQAQIDSNTEINTSQAEDLNEILLDQATEEDIEKLFN